MNKKRAKKNIIFILFLIIICVVAFFGYYIFTDKENPLLEIINDIADNSNNEIKDNYNGIYGYSESYASVAVFNNCTINKINNYILVINDTYYKFRNSCMGTYEKESGKTTDLTFTLDEDTNTYYILEEGIKYSKNESVLSISVSNDIASMGTINLSGYQLGIKETEFYSNYYDLKEIKVKNLSSNLLFNFIEQDNGIFKLSFTKGISTVYSYNISVDDFDLLPDLYTYGSSIAIVEKNVDSINNIYKYTFQVINNNGVVYDLDDYFPIVIDNVTLNTENSIFIKYDSTERVFKMLIGYNSEMCVTDYSDSDAKDITYYEFEITYNQGTSSFNKPEFVKIGYKEDGCDYVDNFIGR